MRNLLNLKNANILILSVLFFSCEDAKLKALKKNQENLKCRQEFINSLIENGTNTMVLGNRLKLNKELDEYNRLQQDHTISCDSLQNAWNRYSTLVYNKSKNLE